MFTTIVKSNATDIVYSRFSIIPIWNAWGMATEGPQNYDKCVIKRQLII